MASWGGNVLLFELRWQTPFEKKWRLCDGKILLQDMKEFRSTVLNPKVSSEWKVRSSLIKIVMTEEIAFQMRVPMEFWLRQKMFQEMLLYL